MTFAVYTTEGKLVSAGSSGAGMNEQTAVASAAERDVRAKDMGISARYEARDGYVRPSA